MSQSETTLLNNVKISADQGFDQWCQDNLVQSYGLPHRGRLYAALVVLANLEKQVWPFRELADVTSTDDRRFFGARALRNHTSSTVASALKSHGRSDLVPAGSAGETGRTSAGTKIAGLHFIWLIRTALEKAPLQELESQGRSLVSYLYDQVLNLLTQYQLLGGIDVPFTASESIAAYISKLLESHHTNSGAVLQHLVGAKLDIRFEGQGVIINHNSVATADVQTGRQGDFEIGSTVFHVTKKATDNHYRKAWGNAENGRKVYLLTPESVLQGTKEFAKAYQEGFLKKVDVFSIEQFIAQNLDELAIFSRNEALKQLERLLMKYNDLISEHENEPSLRIIIPDFGIEDLL